MSHLSSLPQKESPSVFALHFFFHTNPAISCVLPLSVQALGLQAVGDPVFPPVYMIIGLATWPQFTGYMISSVWEQEPLNTQMHVMAEW